MPEFLLVLSVGIFAGTMTGLMGASGMMAVVPGIILLGYTPYEAIGVSLALDVIASATVAVAYYRHGRVDLHRGGWIAVAAVVGAQLGSRLLFRVPAAGLTSLFGVLLLFTAFTFWRSGVGSSGVRHILESFRSSEAAVRMEAYPITVSILIGLVVGVISGMLGVGGGIIFLFALLLLGYTLHEAVGTSTMIMALTTASGTVGHALLGNMPYVIMAVAAVGTLLGSLGAARFANRLNEAALSKAIAVVFALLGVSLLLVSAAESA